MTRIYKDYTIRVAKITSDYGCGFRAEFFIAKIDGTKGSLRIYETYAPRIKAGEVIEQVRKIIDTL